MGGKVIAFANQKGGVGKTTMALTFGTILAQRGNNVLLVDLDSQSNLTTYYGIKDPNALNYTVGDAMNDVINDGHVDGKRFTVCRNSRFQGLMLLPANNEFHNIKQLLAPTYAREYVLSKVLDPLRQAFDYIIIDCAPSLDIDLVNALVSADEVIIVSTPDAFAYNGAEQLMRTIYTIRKVLNPDLKIAGVLCNCVDRRNNFMPEMVRAMRENWEGLARVFDTEIPSSIRVRESQCERLPLILYEKNNAVTKAAESFVDEYLKKFGGSKESPEENQDGDEAREEKTDSEPDINTDTIDEGEVKNGDEEI